MRTYGKVPLWVLVNDPTFGNITHFYQLMLPDDRDRVCAIIARCSRRRSKDVGTLSPRMLFRSCDVLRGFRNICAHDVRLYCSKIEGASLGDMAALLRNVLPEKEVDAYVAEALALCGEYVRTIPTVSSGAMFASMGFLHRS